MRKLLFKIWYRHSQLQAAIYEARDAELLKEPDEHDERATTICWKLRERMQEHMEKEIANIVSREIRGQV